MIDKKFYHDKAAYLVALEQSIMTSERILETIYRLQASCPKEAKDDVEEIDASLRRTMKTVRKSFETIEERLNSHTNG